jgi:hypothetical protein
MRKKRKGDENRHAPGGVGCMAAAVIRRCGEERDGGVVSCSFILRYTLLNGLTRTGRAPEQIGQLSLLKRVTQPLLACTRNRGLKCILLPRSSGVC